MKLIILTQFIFSTNAFDKNPQSQERGITLDLGFSSFTMDMPEHLKNEHYNQLQITLVDCPGHASLIRTIIGGRLRKKEIIEFQ
jgi:selenocysteine-specific elongation factor